MARLLDSNTCTLLVPHTVHCWLKVAAVPRKAGRLVQRAMAPAEQPARGATLPLGNDGGLEWCAGERLHQIGGISARKVYERR